MPHYTDIEIRVTRLEKSLFEIICLMVLAVMIHGFLEGVFLYGMSLLTVVELGIAVMVSIFFYLSKYKNRFESLRIPFIILMNLTLIFFWFWLSGLFGPTGIGAAGIVCISLIIVPAKWRLRLLILGATIILILVLLQVYTEWVRLSPNGYTTLPYDYLVILFAVLLIINYLKSEFDKERRTVLQQNQELLFLNNELEQTVREKEKAIKELKSTQRKLIESEKMASIGRLTAGLAHELNNPLNFIGGSVKPIKEDLLEIRKSLKNSMIKTTKNQFHEIDMLLENIEEGSSRATDIITNLMQVSPRMLDSKNIVDIHDLVRRTCSLVQNAHSNIQLSLIIKDPVQVRGNTVEINQVLLNVIKNAVDAASTKPRGKVVVTVSAKDNVCEIGICDNGPGIPSRNRSQIFEPFFTTKEEGKGTGLGLYISYGIIKKHKGTIRLDTRHKNGAAFIIRLPSV